MSAATNNDQEPSSGPAFARARTVWRDLEQLPDQLRRLGDEHYSAAERIDRVEQRLAALGEQMLELRQRFGTLEDRFTDIQERFTPLQLALEQLQRDLAYLPHQASELDRVRPELAELRHQLAERLTAEREATELVGRLLRAHEARLEALEDRASAEAPAPPA
ncbi:MAG: hypothetical protein M0004_08615 [Actinomycetota bacterium]|nr:hypothetical protein [Actinomycetota bacterium]